jgi:uncharacterized repeat protein (TIGR01451 family)
MRMFLGRSATRSASTGRRRGRRSLGACLVAGAAAAATVLLPTAASAVSIGTDAGPLTTIDIGTMLNCAVNHTGDTAGEWYGSTACATLVAVGGTLYGPTDIPAGGSAAPRSAFTVVSQSAVTGSGTSVDPYTVVTVVAAGTSGLQLTQTDRYVAGEESYRTSIVASNTGSDALTAVLFRAGDCYLQNSDVGYGQVDAATGAVTCTTANDGTGRIEQMYPITPGSTYLEAYYGSVWAAVGTQQMFPSTCECGTYQDNGLGLSWSLSLAAGTHATYDSIVTFSPLGHQPLTLTKTADAASVAAGGSDGYTITVTNPNIAPVVLSLSDALPPGFAYVAGSTTGATTADPTTSGQTLTWSGVSVPAGGTASVHFGVTASSTPGTYTDAADGAADGYTVVGTGATAPVTVTAVVPVNHAPVAQDVSVTTPQDTPVGVTLSASDVDGDALTYAVASGPAHGTLSGSGASLTYTPAAGYSGPDSFTYTANDGQAASAPATVSITVTPAPATCTDAPTLDGSFSADQARGADDVKVRHVAAAAGDLLVAFVAADGPQSPSQVVTKVQGAGLTWTLAARSNATWGTTEVWQAHAGAAVADATVVASLRKGGYDGTLTVAAFHGAADHVGAIGVGAGTHGAPSARLDAACASLVWGVGHDWTNDVTPVAASGQTFVHTFVDHRVHDSFWVQRLSAATQEAGRVTVANTAPHGRDRWTLAAVEIPAAS